MTTSTPVIVGDSRLVCPACGYANAHTRTICKKCRVPLPAEGLAAAKHSHDLVEQYRKREWYQSRWFLIAAFILVNPLWGLLVALDPHQRTLIRIIGWVALGLWTLSLINGAYQFLL